MGTPGYMSPEQIRACGTVDARTDIWALGCVLSELITGTSTFEAPTQIQLGAAILERDPVPLRQKLADAPPELEAIVLRCLAKDPNDRFQDVAALALALYPFGPRRSRLSAERCHEVLHGTSGVVIEFNSVPPPSDSDKTLLMGAPLSAIPASVSGLEPLRTSTPATLSSMPEPTFRPKGRRVVVAAVVAVAAAVGATLGLRSGASGPLAASHDATAGAQAPATSHASTAAAPTVAAPSVAAPSVAAEEPVMVPSPTVSALSAPLELTPRAKPSRPQRAVNAAAAAAAKREAQAKAKSAAPKRAPGVDDSEPDVGY
jgi:serine/threonine-protein kinase